MSWFLMALVAPVLWAIVNHVDKLLLARYGQNKGSIGAIMLFMVVFGAVIIPILFFVDPRIFSVALHDRIILGFSGFSYALFVYFYLHALFHDEASVVMPIQQTVPVFGFILAFVLLGETLTIDQAVGSLIIVAFSFVLVLEIKEFGSFSIKWRPLIYSLTAALVYAASETVFKVGASDGTFSQSLFWNQIGLMAFGLLLALSKANRQGFVSLIRSSAAPVLSLNAVGEILTLAADVATRYAILLAPVALVFAVSGTQPIFVLIFGSVLSLLFPGFFREKLSRRHLIHKCVCVAGITAGSLMVFL